jgi:hypothetical protein
MAKNQERREQSEATRKAAWESSARKDNANRSLQGMNRPGQKNTLADRAKYQFEADSDDDELENRIDDRLGEYLVLIVGAQRLIQVILDKIHGIARTLHGASIAIGQEVDAQNKTLDRLGNKTDRVDDGLMVNRAKLERIK